MHISPTKNLSLIDKSVKFEIDQSTLCKNCTELFPLYGVNQEVKTSTPLLNTIKNFGVL